MHSIDDNPKDLRIYVSKYVRENIFNDIDRQNYFGLKINRIDLFLFALSLGVSLKLKTKLESPDSLARDPSITAEAKALMYALFINELKEETLERVNQLSEVYSLAQEYANTGFNQLASYIHTKSEENLFHEIISELDEKYETINQDD